MELRWHMVWLVLAAAALAAPALAQDDGLETVVVTGDPVHLLETGDSDTAFGLPKKLIDTPRAVTVVSDQTMARYGIEGIDDLTAITPNAYTASYYGVEGAVNLRGTLAESYFRGFKRSENRGTYSTPLGDAAAVDILRGPPSAIYGAGKVGGLVDFVPKSGGPGDDTIAVTYGAYSKRNIAASLGQGFAIGNLEGGAHLYGEVDDSFSFYRGLHPSHQLLEASIDLAGGAWSLSGDYLYYHSNGDVQTPGWNRLTQSLIDNGTYVTGRDTSLTDADGNGRLTLNELGGNPYTFDPNFKALTIAYPGCGSCTDAAHTLDVGVGTTHLSPRTVYIAPGVDFSNTITHTGFAELAREMGGGDKLRLQLFTDTLSNDRFVSYGFPGSYRTLIGETRLRYDSKRSAWDGLLTITSTLGGSYRYVGAAAKESYNSGVIALDRRDISQGPAPNDIIDSPFNTDPPGAIGLGWENDVHTTTGDAGLFAVSDIALDRLDVILGGRYDSYTVRSVDYGVLAFEPPAARDTAGRFTGSASVSYKLGWGLMPYWTYAKNAAVEIGQASEVPTSLIVNDGWLSDSLLNEAGIKFTGLDDHLQASLDWYHQDRTELQQGGGPPTVVGTRGQGEELELRYVATPNLAFTLAGSLQQTTIKGPDHEFAYIPAATAGVSPQNGFGGSYVVYDFSTLPGRGGDYADTLVPHAVVSPYATWTQGEDWGAWGAGFGGTYVSRTEQTVPGGITFPSYVTLNLSGFIRHDGWEASANVNNVADARYFTPGADTYANLSALPGQGRTWRITLKKAF